MAKITPLETIVSTFTGFLNEIRYEDIYSESFLEFQSRYKKMIRKKEINPDTLYVQFTMFTPDELSRNPFLGSEERSLDHQDPAAVYSYPIKYVLNYPADIWYAAHSTYIRILRDTSKNTLLLNAIDEYYFRNVMKSKLRSVYRDVDEAIDIAMHKKSANYSRYSGPNKWGKLFFGLIQVDYSAEPEVKDTLGRMAVRYYPVRSNTEQTRILKEMGYDSIEDTSKSAQSAVINDREPEQKAFFNRYAFEVVESIRINPNADRINISDNISGSSISRKFANNVASILGNDKLKDGPLTANLNGWEYYWTVGGRRIELDIRRDDSYYEGKQMFQPKKHKEYKDNNAYKVQLRVKTEYGDIDDSITMYDSLNDLLPKVKKQWDILKTGEVLSDWTKETRDSYLKNIERIRGNRIQDNIILEFINNYDKGMLQKNLNAMTDYINVDPISIPEISTTTLEYKTIDGTIYAIDPNEYVEYSLCEKLDRALNSITKDFTIRKLIIDGEISEDAINRYMENVNDICRSLFEIWYTIDRTSEDTGVFSKLNNYHFEYGKRVYKRIQDILIGVAEKSIREYSINPHAFYKEFVKNTVGIEY